MERGQEPEALRGKLKSSLNSGPTAHFLEIQPSFIAWELCNVRINLSSLELVGVCSLLPKAPNLEQKLSTKAQLKPTDHWTRCESIQERGCCKQFPDIQWQREEAQSGLPGTKISQLEAAPSVRWRLPVLSMLVAL